MVDEVLDPGVVGVALRWLAVLPADVAGDARGAPLLHVERRVREHRVSTEVAVLRVEQRVAELDVTGEAVDGQVHPGDTPGSLIVFLAVDRDIVRAAAVGFDEPAGLHE